jgi:hypothetical protein
LFAHKVPAEVGLLKEAEAFGEDEEDGQRQSEHEH